MNPICRALVFLAIGRDTSPTEHLLFLAVGDQKTSLLQRLEPFMM